MHRELIKGTLDTMILNLLKTRGRLYGYQITKLVSEASDGAIQIKEGSLYPALHRLERDGTIRSETELVGNRPRKYYSLTPEGNKVTANKLAELSQFIRVIGQVLPLKPQHYGTID